MKTKIFLIATVLLVFVTACKDKENKEGTTEQAQPEKAVKENFSVELDVAASKKDDFSLYYTEDNTLNFKGEMALWHGVTGNNTREKVLYDLSEELVPTDIRLDFGMNKDQEVVTVYNVKISYYGNEMSFIGSDFFKYFIESKDFKTEIDVPNGALKIMKNGPEYKTPFFYPRQELIDALKKLTTTK
jgi:hypothetical protein